jgi:hypothetical protein
VGRVIFLFNHDAGHQVAHLAAIAGAFARRHRGTETVVAFATAAIRARIEAAIRAADARLIRWEELRLPRSATAVGNLADRILPASRILRLRINAALFAGADVVASTERTCLRLRDHLPAGQAPQFVIVPHGAGDRNVSYHPDFARFDRLLVAGRKVVDQMVAHGVPARRIEVIGYPKFEGIDLSTRRDLFGNGRPTFVYNPHFDPHLSSWYRAGPDLLRWFASEEGSQYNCIFAPHVMLFRKRWHISPEYRVVRRRPDVPSEALAARNILIDVDSPSLFDMTYTLAADAYIGDVSSQIYEFLARPRPAFFLECRKRIDPHAERLHLFRDAGPVARSVAELAPMLAEHAHIGSRYRTAQEDLFAYTFSASDRPVSECAASAIEAAIRSATPALRYA